MINTVDSTTKEKSNSDDGLHLHRRQGFDATLPHFYEGPSNDLDYLEIWCYTDKLSYKAGDDVCFHLNTTAIEIALYIYRDGKTLEFIKKIEHIPGKYYQTPKDFYVDGCNWPVGYSWKTPADLSSGFYLVICKVRNGQGEEREHEAGFFIRPKVGRPTASILLIAATNTWTAYNDWGGTNNYVGLCDGFTHGKSPQLTIHRPWAKGFLSIPEGAPRKPHDYVTKPGSIPRYPPIEFAFTRGYSKYYANAGWASYERLFAQWAEQQGYQLDYATQIDLHCLPDLVTHYPCVAIVGHDEYWTLEMRQVIDHYIDNGGHLARFAGDFAWQIRLENQHRIQVCYKDEAVAKDPVIETEDSHLLTSLWDDPRVGWKGAETLGLTSTYGTYAGVGHIAPRHNGGFTVYRPGHWVFKDTDLCYGDQFGSNAKIFGYEVDGLDYVIRDGVPEPTYRDGAIADTQILAMGLAGNAELDHGNKGTVRYYGSDEIPQIARTRYGEVTGRTKAAAARGSGMIVLCSRGKGQLFNAGSCEWVSGLKQADIYTQTITHNVLNRFTRNTE